MQYLIKEAGSSTWKTIEIKSLETAVKEGRLKTDWLIRLEGRSEHSTVENLLTAMSADQTGAQKVVSLALAEMLLVGMGGRVTAIAKADGRQLWSTDLRISHGISFVTFLVDGPRLFAATHGQLHCLDLASGRILWTNKMQGFGYGVASLCLASGQSSPETAIAGATHPDEC